MRKQFRKTQIVSFISCTTNTRVRQQLVCPAKRISITYYVLYKCFVQTISIIGNLAILAIYSFGENNEAIFAVIEFAVLQLETVLLDASGANELSTEIIFPLLLLCFLLRNLAIFPHVTADALEVIRHIQIIVTNVMITFSRLEGKICQMQVTNKDVKAAAFVVE